MHSPLGPSRFGPARTRRDPSLAQQPVGSQLVTVSGDLGMPGAGIDVPGGVAGADGAGKTGRAMLTGGTGIGPGAACWGRGLGTSLPRQARAARWRKVCTLLGLRRAAPDAPSAASSPASSAASVRRHALDCGLPGRLGCAAQAAAASMAVKARACGLIPLRAQAGAEVRYRAWVSAAAADNLRDTNAVAVTAIDRCSMN